MNKFYPFESYATLQQAEEVSLMLTNAGIENSVMSDVTNLDSNFVGVQFGNKFFVQVALDNFEKARTMLLQQTEVKLEEVEKDYMLFEFSDTELLEVVSKPDEWGRYNYHVAKAILARRNVAIAEPEIVRLREQHLDELSRMKSVSKSGLIILYSLTILVFAVPIFYILNMIGKFGFLPLPGWAVVAYSYYIAFSRKTLPNGGRINSFDDRSRWHGKLIFFSTLIGTIFTLALYRMNGLYLGPAYHF